MNGEATMRFAILASAMLAAAVFAIRPTPTTAAGPWCYFNEEVHCTEVSFEMCHFGTQGNGGYCFPNPWYRNNLRTQPVELVRGGTRYGGWYANPWYPVDYGYPSYREHQQMIAGPGFGWCYGWGICARPFQSYPFGGFGYESSWYGSPWYYGANYRWGQRFAQHHRHSYSPRGAIASAAAENAADALAAARQEPDIIDPRLALASADPHAAMNIEIGSKTGGQAVVPPAGKRSANGVPTINVGPSCSAGAALGLDQSVESCFATETNARDQLARDWDHFPPADRSSCVKVATTGGGGSYTAVLSCLEMKRDARNLMKEKASGLLAGR